MLRRGAGTTIAVGPFRLRGRIDSPIPYSNMEDASMNLDRRWFSGIAVVLFCAGAVVLAAVSRPAAAFAHDDDEPLGPFGPWSEPVNLGPAVNSPYNDNSPAISKDGLSLYITSSPLPSPPGSRPGGRGGADIWVSQRASIAAPGGEPVDLGPNITSAGADGVPSLSTDGHRLYFHSTGRGGCGAADMFVSRRKDTRDDFGCEPPENLGCVVNSPFADNGPTIFEDDATGITTLYFNSPRPGGLGGVDIYASRSRPTARSAQASTCRSSTVRSTTIALPSGATGLRSSSPPIAPAALAARTSGWRRVPPRSIR